MTTEKKCCTYNLMLRIFIVISGLLICLGILAAIFHPNLYRYMVEKELVMKPGNEAYNNWYSPPSPVYMQYFMFNYTNVADILAKGSKPQVQQIGPYSYKEIRINAVVEQNDYEITYLQNYSYVFDPVTSCQNCSESDMIWAPDIAVLTILNKMNALNSAELIFVATFFNIYQYKQKVSLFQYRSVYEMLWGYKDSFLTNIRMLEDKIPKFIADLLNLEKIDPYVVLQHNGTKEAESIGNITILTGKSNINDVQKVIKWRGLNHTDKNFWKTMYGRMLNGSDGSHTQPFLERNSKVYLFTADLARSLYVEYESDITVFDITLYRHTTSQWLFMNSSVNPDNEAFCGPTKCWGTGLLPIGQTQDGNPPLFMSSPHFYQGDQKLVDAINGLHPNKSLHATFLDAEPTTGIVMQAHKRLQINILVQPLKLISITENIHEDVFLPILYVDEQAMIDQKSADKFKSEVLKPKVYLEAGSYTILGIGVLILLVVIAVFSRRFYKKRKNNEYKEFKDADCV
ncbi:lysosome membrane protein 2 isoform X1 [Hydra vulgaris]|uniref:lysosome membrane protein 2 isoform X1 n=1 Tax=Hydra vulgaris TaxID=6087 RepID=UPI0006411DA2|nr:lysosome membrane protein 2 [Hydra vulgaris]